jgi:hypothetical protein
MLSWIATVNELQKHLHYEKVFFNPKGMATITAHGSY